MKSDPVWAVGLVLAVCLLAPSMMWADVSDNFDDFKFSRFPSGIHEPFAPFGGDDPNYDPRLPGYDPNLWDPNNPDWVINDFIGNVFSADANTGALRLYANNSFPISFIGAECSDGDLDPNTSTTFFDDSAPHYILSYVIVVTPGTGMTGLWTHFNYLTWEAYAYAYEPWDGFMVIGAASGTDVVSGPSDHRYWCVVKDAYLGDPNYYDPNRPTDANYVVDPNYYNGHFDPDHPDPNGFWMLFQFDPWGLNLTPGGIIDANDPNCHWLRGAWWRPGEAWDGQWQLEVSLADPAFDPNTHYFTSGTSVFASFGDSESGVESDIAYDDFEAKWGYYKTRTLTITMKDCCDLTISPDRLDDPNGDPNDLSELRRFSISAPIVLDAVTPCGNKSFKKWRIYGPNGPGDPAYQEVNDTNAVLYLTMNGDYEVKAVCKCGGGGLEPFAGIVLLVLGLGLVIRRLR